MPLFLHKLLPIVVLPIGFSIVVLSAALLWRKRWLSAIGVGILTVSSMPIVGESLLKILENRFPRLEVEECPPADAIVVLSGILHETRSKRGGLEWGESVDRFEQGVLLMKAQKAPLLIFTGGRIPWMNRQLTEGDDLRRAAVMHGIPADAILVTGEISNTAEEAQAVRKIAGARGLKRIILVTTAWAYAAGGVSISEGGRQCDAFSGGLLYALPGPTDLARLSPTGGRHREYRDCVEGILRTAVLQIRPKIMRNASLESASSGHFPRLRSSQSHTPTRAPSRSPAYKG